MTYKLKSSETSNLSTGKTTSKKTYSYDENGNNIKEVDSIKNITKEMNYDVDNRLDTYTLTENDKTTTQSNLYNGDGQRIQKSEGDNSINYYYQNGSVLYTTDKDEKKTSHNFVGLEGNTISTMRYDLTGLEYYVYNKDIKGSTTNIIDNNKNAKISYKYSDFGETEEFGGIDFYNEIAYTGGIYDQSTSLYYLNARYYNPEDARFITQDTYRGEINEPSSLHLYAYCANNPINYIDPSGHSYIEGKKYLSKCYSKWIGAIPYDPPVKIYVQFKFTVTKKNKKDQFKKITDKKSWISGLYFPVSFSWKQKNISHEFNSNKTTAYIKVVGVMTGYFAINNEYNPIKLSLTSVYNFTSNVKTAKI